MKISVITVVYNDIDGIESTIASVLSQQYDNIEYIIVDGGSTDGTREIVEGYRDRGVKVISEADNGIYDAMNKGAALATGEYVLFLNSGDSFFSDDVGARFAALDAHEDLVYGSSMYRRPDGKTWICKGNMDHLLKGMPFSHQACFVRTSIQNRLKFDNTFRITADYDFILRAHKQGFSFRPIEIIVANYCMDGVSSTDLFRSSIEALHALLNYDTGNTLDLSRTECFARLVVEKLLHIDDGLQLDAFLGSMRDCRAISFFRNPVRKAQFFREMVSAAVRLYRSM